MIAYLAPEIPLLSTTFVYEELHALERSGVRVLPFAVRTPSTVAPGQHALARRTTVLYGMAPWKQVLLGAASAARFGRRSLVALSWLGRDMWAVGLHRPIAWKLGYQWLVGARLAGLLRAARCTHLHVHFAHVPTHIGMYASAFSGIPFTVMAHANDIFERGLLLAEKARRAKAFLTISEHNVSYLRAAGAPADKTAVVRCSARFAVLARAPRYQRRSRYRIGTLGRLVEKKGFDDVLRAVALLASAPWGVELSVAGDGPLRAELEALAATLGIADRVRFEGALAHAAVPAWLRSIDAFVLACKRDRRGDMDGIPVVLVEAMSQRVPVVSTRLSGIPELVVDGRTGLLAPPEDPPALAAALVRLLDDPGLRARLAGEAARHIQAEFDPDLNIARLMKHLSVHGAGPRAAPGAGRPKC